MQELIRTTPWARPTTELRVADGVLHYRGQQLPLAAVTALRHGAEAIRFWRGSLGTRYVLSLQAPAQTLDVVLWAWLDWREPYFEQVYTALLRAVWPATGQRLVQEARATLLAGGTVTIGPCQLTAAGLTLKGRFIPWDDLSCVRNYDRLTVGSKTDLRVWTSLYYLRDYNVDLLWRVLRWVLERGGRAALAQLGSGPAA